MSESAPGCARNGSNSRASSVARSAAQTGSVRCESVRVSPWPGACFKQAATPLPRKPSSQAPAFAAT